MILDILENVKLYLAINKGFAKALEFLSRPDLKELPAGRHEIDGTRVYALVINGPGKKKEDAPLEIHKRYIDIQLVLAGTDNMGWKPTLLCKKPSREYDGKSDIQFFADEPDTWLTTKSGAFAIFFPEDAHAPMISSGELHKIVVKVALDQT